MTTVTCAVKRGWQKTKDDSNKRLQAGSGVKPSEKRRKTSKNSQKYIKSFLFLFGFELYDDPFL